MRAHEVVVRYIEQQLSQGNLKLEGRLPSERELAETLTVSRPSVREAFRVLEAMGVIRTAVGSGPSAGAFVVAEPTAAIAATFRMHLASSHWPVSELIDMRVMLETWAVGIAAALPHSIEPARGALATASELLQRMSDPELPAATFHELDAEFHTCFVRASNNSLVEATMNGLRGAINSYVIQSVQGREDWPGIAARLVSEHTEIYQAIVRGDAVAAQHSCRSHIEGFYRDYVTAAKL